MLFLSRVESHNVSTDVAPARQRPTTMMPGRVLYTPTWRNGLITRQGKARQLSRVDPDVPKNQEMDGICKGEANTSLPAIKYNKIGTHKSQEMDGKKKEATMGTASASTLADSISTLADSISTLTAFTSLQAFPRPGLVISRPGLALSHGFYKRFESLYYYSHGLHKHPCRLYIPSHGFYKL
jgi:hypothetical protein